MMRFNPGAFDRHLASIGQKIVWRRSYACACVNPNSGAPDPKHALCLGKGRIWVEGVPTVVGVARQDVNSEWAKAGLWENGDAVLSIPQNSPMWEAGQFDRITMLNAEDSFSMPLVRGAPTEKLLFTPVRIDRVFWLHPQNKAEIVEGRAPVFGADGVPSWPGGEGEPPAGVSYSITGTKYDEYFLYDMHVSDRNQHSGMRLPKKVVARRWDLFGR